MLQKITFLLLFSQIFHGGFTENLTFKNVMVVCENEVVTDEEITFVTIVTANNLKEHLPTGQNCFRIEIEHANVPVLYYGALANIKQVNYLLLENNGIREIYAGAFKNLTVREGMSLKFNKLTEIHDGVFDNVAVPSLYLSSNFITKIHPRAFDNMPTLEALYLDNNKLTYIDGNWFRNTPNLYKIVLRHNFIAQIPAFAFKNLISRKTNQLYLDLSYNFIKIVDIDAFRKPTKYGYISLANNQIQDLKSDWLKGVYLRKLDISNNRLMCLVENGLAAQTNFVDGNPWICSCLEDMKRKEDEGIFGRIVGDESFKRCNILVS